MSQPPELWQQIVISQIFPDNSYTLFVIVLPTVFFVRDVFSLGACPVDIISYWRFLAMSVELIIMESVAFSWMKQFLEHVERFMVWEEHMSRVSACRYVFVGFRHEIQFGSLFREEFFQGLSVGKYSTTGKLFQPTIKCFPAKKA